MLNYIEHGPSKGILRCILAYLYKGLSVPLLVRLSISLLCLLKNCISSCDFFLGNIILWIKQSIHLFWEAALLVTSEIQEVCRLLYLSICLSLYCTHYMQNLVHAVRQSRRFVAWLGSLNQKRIAFSLAIVILP